MSTLMMSSTGEIQLPPDLQGRHGFAPGVPIRIIETSSGVLLIPLCATSADPLLADELGDWQQLAAEAWQTFPYEV